ncbi:MAG: hypothetical protein ACK553_14395 [Planctomycetota bacterium]
MISSPCDTIFMQHSFRNRCFGLGLACAFLTSLMGESRAQGLSGPLPFAVPEASVSVEIDPPHDLPRDLQEHEGVELPENIDPDELKTIDGFSSGFCTQEYCVPRSRRYTTYRQQEDAWTYLPGDGDQFGWFDMEDTPYIARRKRSGLTAGLGLHLLSGPNAVPLPPRLWDFILGYQARNTISDVFSYDLAATAGIYSDFEDSARDGVRFPAHAVGMLHMSESWDWVAGVDYLDRDDYKILPVAGFSWHSSDFPNWNVDMIFPRPRVDFALTPSDRLYMGGVLGGGTWDIEMPGDVNDVMTYRDFRLVFGMEQLEREGIMAVELGYVFGRQVSFRTLSSTTEFDDGFMIRWVARR